MLYLEQLAALQDHLAMETILHVCGRKENGKAREILIRNCSSDTGGSSDRWIVNVGGSGIFKYDCKSFRRNQDTGKPGRDLFHVMFGFISSYCGVRYTAYRKDRQDREVKILQRRQQCLRFRS